MEIASGKAKSHNAGGASAHSAFRTERFIPPTHPAYIITPHFTSPHIKALQE